MLVINMQHEQQKLAPPSSTMAAAEIFVTAVNLL
jgi:hypothetical protein